MSHLILIAVLFALAGCGDGSLVESEVNPQVTDSANPQVNPTIAVNVPVSVLGL